MFEENENLVEEETTENAEEQTAEENVNGNGETIEDEGNVETEETTEEPIEEPKEKLYTKQEVDDIKIRTKRRIENKVRREYEKKYGRAETVIKAGMQKENFDEAVDELADYYTQEGVSIPKIQYSDRDTEILANAEANEIIEAGYDEIVEETDRLAKIGYENMNKSDKIIFNKLAEERKKIEEEKELSSLGLGKDANTDEFKEFSKKLNPELSMKDKYEMYLKFQPKPKVETIGSMKNTKEDDKGVKDFYTRDEALKFTKQDFDKNPALFKAVENSMSKW